MIHYHGTPITPRVNLYTMAGKHFCVSFAHPSDAKVCLQIGQSIMWDNGAFTTYKSGKVFDVQKFYKWLDDKLGHPHWAVIPDVIGGTEQEQRQLLKTWPFDKSFGAPVWHMAMSLDYLNYLCDNFGKVCFGSSGEYWQVGSDKWANRADTAFNYLMQKQRSLPWLHMLRGLSLCGERWPFASADSVNVARNHKDYGIMPNKMADRIDAVQSPIFWKQHPTQRDLL